MQKEQLTLLEQGQLRLIELMSVLPISWTSAIGHYLGKRSAKQAIRNGENWIQDIHKTLQHLRGIEDFKLREQQIIEWTGRIGCLRTQFTILQRLVQEGYLEVIGQENLQNISQPTIFVSCHLAHWELVGHTLTRLPNRGCALYAPLKNPIYEVIATRVRQSWKTNTELVSASPRAMFQLTRALKAGSNLLLFIDEEREGYIWGPSLGRKLPYAGNRWLAARLAIRHQLDIVPCFVEQIDEFRYRVVIEPKLQRGNGDAESCARFLADQMDERMDQWVRERLEQWYWLSWLDLDKPLPRF
ncbi:MAG: lysophospholipid acyltransferase family protein [Snowella sp.]|nr:lysophospholipid acyltransferase family protein [Snowella sp.]